MPHLLRRIAGRLLRINAALLYRLTEGRPRDPAQLDLDGCFSSFRPDRENVLLVSHEASLTGAPIISLNIVQQLVARYNLVVILLEGGPIASAFREAGAVVVHAHKARRNQAAADATIRALCRRIRLKYALVNSIESRYVLPALNCQGIPSLSLIHEFAANTRPRHAFREALSGSTAMVFSTEITLESARKELSHVDWPASHTQLLPQGYCTAPALGLDAHGLSEERARIARTLRPLGDADDRFVVLGVGYIQIRKGLDIFIQCAADLVATVGPGRIRFVWIGDGLDTDRDTTYSVLLIDQIERAGLQDTVVFANETPAIEAAYKMADVMLVSSRLDPLPNVAIEAMTHGLPVLCFEKTTGIATVLQDNDLGDACVAKYLDTRDMAAKLAALMQSKAEREVLGARVSALAKEHFDMPRYAAELDARAVAAAARMQQQRQDVSDILALGRIRADFCHPPQHGTVSAADLADLYVRGWAAGTVRRKPVPGFHPGVYKAAHREAPHDAEAYADYLRRGAPAGPWQLEVIDHTTAIDHDLTQTLRVAVHLHVYYVELLESFMAGLERNVIRPDLLISVPDHAVRDAVLARLQHYTGKVVNVSIVPNRGRDIGPLLTGFGTCLINDYDIVGHFHTKASKFLDDASIGATWRTFIMENLLGGKHAGMTDRILSRMQQDASIGLVFPDDPNVLDWSMNRAVADGLARQLGLDTLPDHFSFPVGTMFWARSAALKPFVDLGLQWTDYPDEPIGNDGTMLHAIERLLPIVTERAGMRCVVTNIVGITR